MKILFDHQVYNDQNYGGISRYFFELTKELLNKGHECSNSIVFSENEFTIDTNVFSCRPFTPFNFKGRGILKKYFNQKNSEKIIRKGEYDLFHPTYYDPYHLDLIPSDKPFVFTFHDLIHEKLSKVYPKVLSNVETVISNRRELLDRSSAVIAVSQSTKNDIIEFYKTPPNKIHVIHLADSINLNNLKRDNSWGEYILFVGNRDGYKNFSDYVTSIQPLLIREKSLKLICAGGGKFNHEEEKLLTSLNVFSQVHQVPINDTILTKLYHNALFFVFPSIYEGFGIPTLEAFSSECPVLLSNVSSLPEVAGDAALYLDPNDQDDMLSKTEYFYYNLAVRKEYKNKGIKQALKYSWTKTSSKTIDLYRSLL